jgi:probable phosphoglycerate mutase
MMNRLVFMRHGATDEMGTMLCGRQPGIHLNEEGVTQAHEAAKSIRNLNLTQILTSPLERAAETARHLASLRNYPIVHSAAFHECDFGDWTGFSFSSLKELIEWKRFNSMRSLLAAPSGETLFDVQYRAISGIRQLLRDGAGTDHLIVTHADVIRAVVCFFTGTPLDLHLRYSVRPASFTVLEIDEWAMRIEGINLMTLSY